MQKYFENTVIKLKKRLLESDTNVEKMYTIKVKGLLIIENKIS